MIIECLLEYCRSIVKRTPVKIIKYWGYEYLLFSNYEYLLFSNLVAHRIYFNESPFGSTYYLTASEILLDLSSPTLLSDIKQFIEKNNL